MRNPHLTRATREAFAWLLFSFFALLLVSASQSCTPFGKAFARGVLDVANATCIVANADRSDAEVRSICGIVDALDEPMRELLKASREKVAAERAAERDQVAFSKNVECHFRELGGFKDGGR